MVVGNENDMRDKLMNARGFCPNCGASLTFEDSARLAKSHGVSENAVMCPDCQKVFNVNLTPDKMTFLGEIKKYNFSKSANTQQTTSLPSDYQKRLSRDRKIIFGAIAFVVIIILIALAVMPNVQYSGESYNLDDYYDMSSSSNVNVRITDDYQATDGWCYIYGKITPKSTDTSDYKAIVIFYDDHGDEIGSDMQYLTDDDNEMLLGEANLGNDEVDSVEIGIIDDEDDLVARTTHHVI